MDSCSIVTCCNSRSMVKPGYLVLQSGQVFGGQFGGHQPVMGEVVFNTSHSGYEEIMTDPSYYQQIVVMTSPMQGNYGSYPASWESERYQAQGFICLELQNSIRDHAFLEQLKKQNKGIMTELDTRALTHTLREQGTTWGVMLSALDSKEAVLAAQEYFKKIPNIDKDWVYAVSTKQISMLPGGNPTGPRVGLLDFGVKHNIIREVQKRASQVIIFPARTSELIIQAHQLQALVLSNGPGNPEDVQVAPQTIKSLIGKLPIMAICMGHQLLARALGGQTYKLKFGHRGSNHPIKDEVLKCIYMASHNHGYAVEAKSLPLTVKVSMHNLNDQTVAGFMSISDKLLSVQYHPESCPGPTDSRELFDYFFKELI